MAAIDRFQLQRGTAIGSGIVLSLATLFPDAGIDLSQITGARNMPLGPGEKPKKDFTPVAPGSYGSGAIILLTDGQRTTGPDPMDAAKMAADRGVKVYAVGIGTKEGETIGFEGWSMRVRLDEDTLKDGSVLDTQFGGMGGWVASTLVRLGDLKFEFLPPDPEEDCVPAPSGFPDRHRPGCDRRSAHARHRRGLGARDRVLARRVQGWLRQDRLPRAERE